MKVVIAAEGILHYLGNNEIAKASREIKRSNISKKENDLFSFTTVQINSAIIKNLHPMQNFRMSTSLQVIKPLTHFL